MRYVSNLVVFVVVVEEGHARHCDQVRLLAAVLDCHLKLLLLAVLCFVEARQGLRAQFLREGRRLQKFATGRDSGRGCCHAPLRLRRLNIQIL